MEPIYQDFKKDINHLKSVLKLAESIKSFSSTSEDLKPDPGDDLFLQSANDVYAQSRLANFGMTFLPGTLLLYLGGRLEYFVKTLFEELALSVAIKCKKFDRLPRDFKDNLFIFTSEVIKSPRKYNHAENGRSSFITNLSNNVNGLDIEEINSKCLSITSENMRSNVLNDLFKRVGAKDVWEKLGQQAKLQIFFETAEAQKAQTESKKFLDDFMDVRNKVAHPSGSFEWPNSTIVLRYIEFFEILGQSLLEICAVYETSLVPQQKDGEAVPVETASATIP